MREQSLAAQIAGEAHEVLDAKRARERAHRFERRSGADDHGGEIAKSLDLDQIGDRAHEMIDAILLVDDAEIAEHELAPAAQSGLWLYAMDALAVGHSIDDFDQRRRLAAATDGQVFERRVGRDDEIRHRVAHALEKHERPIEEALVAVFDDEKFWPDIVLIEDELLAHELERRGDQKDEIGRIAGLDDRKAALPVNLDQEPEFMEERRRVFAEVSKRPAPLRRQRVPIDRDVVDDLEPLRIGRVRRADHRDQPAGAGEGLSLLPDAPIEWDGQIFDDDDTGTGLTRRRHVRLSIAGFIGFVKNGGSAPVAPSRPGERQPSPPNPRPTQT